MTACGGVSVQQTVEGLPESCGQVCFGWRVERCGYLDLVQHGQRCCLGQRQTLRVLCLPKGRSPPYLRELASGSVVQQ